MFQKQFQSIKKEWLIINQANRKGFSVIEAIVAVSIFMLLVSAIIGGLVSSNKSSTFFGSKSRATMIAEEGLEAIRNIQDEDFSNLIDGNYGLIISANQWKFSGTEDVIGGYTRQINISSIDNDTKQVISNVEWDYRGENKSISLTTYFTNWGEETTISIDSCATFCQSLNYFDGTCRKNSGVCNRNKEVYELGGDEYCVEESKNNTCCCLP